MKIRRWVQITRVMVAATCLVIATTAATSAQGDLQLESLEIDLWPELDRPEMLIIYRGMLKADVSLPATLSLRIPPQVGVPHAVAYSDEDGSLFDATYSTTASDAALTVTLETPSRAFQLEFYDKLTYDGDLRSYSFVWPGDYAVDQFNIAFLPPPDATEIRTQPSLSAAQQSSGETIYLGKLGTLAQDQTTQVDVTYRGTETSRVIAPTTSADEDVGNTALIAALALAVLGLVIVGGVWYTRRLKLSQTTTTKAQRPKSGKRRPKATADRPAPTTAGHCTQCGRALGLDDRFCGRCGAPVKGRK